MDSRLRDAAYAGDVATLRQLLREDRLLLHRLTATDALPTDSPLHIAAALGHHDFVKEILSVRQELAGDPNGEGLTALHLASSHGHLSVVKEFLQSTSASQLCLLRDKDGLMSIHAAAVKGRVDVLRELIDAFPETLRAQTGHGYSVLHLAVLSNNFDNVKFLVEKINEDDDLLNLKDDNDNTILHLAVAMKQLQTVKLLLGREGIKVNELNSRGATALDVLLESTIDLHGDLLLGEAIRAAGGRTAAEQGNHQQPQPQTAPVETSGTATATTNNSARSNRLSLIRRVRKKLLGHAKGDQFDEKLNNTPGTIMVVATLIATITFQAGLSPPGGFNQENGTMAKSASATARCKHYNPDKAKLKVLPQIGEAFLNDCLGPFLILDTVGLFASLSIILLLLCCIPRRTKKVMRILVLIMWIAVFSTAMAFLTAIGQIFNHTIVILCLFWCWFCILSLFMLWLYIRLSLCLLRKVGLCKKKRSDGENQAEQAGAAVVVKRILVVVLIIVLLGILGVAGFGSHFMFKRIINSKK